MRGLNMLNIQLWNVNGGECHSHQQYIGLKNNTAMFYFCAYGKEK